MGKLICPGCYEEITDLVGTTSTTTEEVEGYVVYHTKCDPIQAAAGPSQHTPEENNKVYK